MPVPRNDPGGMMSMPPEAGISARLDAMLAVLSDVPGLSLPRFLRARLSPSKNIGIPLLEIHGVSIRDRVPSQEELEQEDLWISVHGDILSEAECILFNGPCSRVKLMRAGVFTCYPDVYKSAVIDTAQHSSHQKLQAHRLLLEEIQTA